MQNRTSYVGPELAALWTIMEPTRIYADFNNADARGRLRLNGAGTLSDLRRLGEALHEGRILWLVDGELEALGRVEYSTDEEVWTGVIDWEELG